jgi:YVTN family beta-propeller protein
MRRPQWMVITAICLFLFPVFGNTIKTYRIRRVGTSPNFIALSPDGKTIYATSYGTDELLAVDLEQKVVTQSVVVGSSPLGLAVDETGETAFVACKDSGTVAVVDLGSFRVV